MFFRKLSALFFRLLFRIPFFRHHYYWFVKHIFGPMDLFRGLKLEGKLENRYRMVLRPGEWIQQHIWFLGTYDPKGLRFLKKYLRKDHVFIDIGANIGVFSLVASDLAGKVVAFEAVPKVAALLREHLKMNEIGNVEVAEMAVYERKTELSFFLSSERNLGMSSMFHHDTESSVKIRVPAVSLDEYLEERNIEQADLIKMDIEGGEYFALKGMQNVLERFSPAILMEISHEVLKNTPDTPGQIFSFMKARNYRLFILDESGKPIPANEEDKNRHENFLFIKKASL